MADTPNAASLTRRPRVAGEALCEWHPLEHLLLFVGLHHQVTCLYPARGGAPVCRETSACPGKGEGTTAVLSL